MVRGKDLKGFALSRSRHRTEIPAHVRRRLGRMIRRGFILCNVKA